MTNIPALLDAYVAQLEAAGIRATYDGRDANPPCVLFRPPTVTTRFGAGSWDAEITAWLMVPDTGMRTALAALSELLDSVQAALGFAVVTARPDETTLADGSTVPVFVTTWTLRVPA